MMKFVFDIIENHCPITVDSKSVRISRKNVLIEHYNHAVNTPECIGKNIIMNLGANSTTRIYAALQFLKAIHMIHNRNQTELLEDQVATPTKDFTTNRSSTKQNPSSSTSKTTSYRLKPNLQRQSKKARSSKSLAQEFVATGPTSEFPDANTTKEKDIVIDDTDEEGENHFDDAAAVASNVTKTDDSTNDESTYDITDVGASSSDRFSVETDDNFGTLSVQIKQEASVQPLSSANAQNYEVSLELLILHGDIVIRNGNVIALMIRAQEFNIQDIWERAVNPNNFSVQKIKTIAKLKFLWNFRKIPANFDDYDRQMSFYTPRSFANYYTDVKYLPVLEESGGFFYVSAVSFASEKLSLHTVSGRKQFATDIKSFFQHVDFKWSQVSLASSS